MCARLLRQRRRIGITPGALSHRSRVVKLVGKTTKKVEVGKVLAPLMALSVGLVLLSALCEAVSADDHRIALVIGNSSYQHSPLSNPVNDATLMGETLRGLGFDVSVKTNVTQKDMKRAITDFGTRLDQAGSSAMGLFYYAGHGVQSGQINYLIPLEAEIDKEADLDVEAVSAQWVLGQMEHARNAMNMVILDACRNNPYERSFRTGGLRGLTAIGKAPAETLIAYSAAKNRVSQDGPPGGNSPYTKALVKAMGTPGWAVERVFKETRKAVQKETNGKQTPWEEGSLVGDYYLASGAPPPGGAARAYERARRIHTVAAYQDIITRFPGSDEAKLARTQIEQIEQIQIQQTSGGKMLRDCPECPQLVVVPAGSYTMGQLRSEKVQGRRFKPEVPEHKVTIGRKFAVGVYEVTFSQWDACHRAGGCSHAPHDNGWGRGNLPVIDVSWKDAKEYVGWLSRKTRQGYRLLSESEWEYVARAGTAAGPFHTGASISTTQANYDGSHAGGLYRGRTVDVDSLAPNAFGLHGMHGNVREWVEDCWHSDYHGAPDDGRAWILGGSCKKRVLRDGSWRKDHLYARASYRVGVDAQKRFNDIGFRVARTLRR